MTIMTEEFKQERVAQIEAMRTNLRELIESTGRTYKSISEQTGIPYSTLLRRMKVSGSDFTIRDIARIWEACGSPGKISELFA